jgi:hypothetical protein
MSGDENGGGHEEGGGFIPESWEPAIKKGESIFGGVGDALTGLDVGNRISGALPYANMLSKFAGGGIGDTASALWQNKSALWGAGSTAAEEGHGFLGGASKALGPIGQAMGAVNAVTGGIEVANDIKKEGFDDGHGGGAYHDANAYNHAGGAALGAAHAILPMLGPYGKAADLGLSVGEVGAKYGGQAAGWAFGDQAKFSADSVAGGLIRGTFGDQSMGEQVRQGIGNTFGHGGVANAVGWGADVLTNSAMLPQQLGTTIGKGIWNEGSAIVDGIANGKGAVGGWLKNSAAPWVENTASNAWNGAKNLGSSALNTASNLGHSALNAGSSALNWAGNEASSLGHSALNAGSSALNWAGNEASNLGHSALNAGSSALNWAGNTASNLGNGALNAGKSALNTVSSGASTLAHGASSVVSSVMSW